MLRKNIALGTEIGVRAAKEMKNGSLVSDEVMVKLIDQELNKIGAQQNWLLDGFPRTMTQAQTLDHTLESVNQPLNLVIHLNVPEDVILQRIMGKEPTFQRLSPKLFSRSLLSFFFLRRKKANPRTCYHELTHIFFIIIDRWVHIPSGRVYNMTYNPPKRAGLDDVTGEPLERRPDDNPVRTVLLCSLGKTHPPEHNFAKLHYRRSLI